MQNQTFEGFRLSPQQKRVWSLQQAGQAACYRAQSAVLIEGALDRAALRGALEDVVRRNEILRTTFRRASSMDLPLQVVLDLPAADFDEHDLSGLGEHEQDERIVALMSDRRSHPLDLARGPVLKTTLARLSTGRHALILTLPAMCADLTSLEILTGQLACAYAARDPRPEPADEAEQLQYADIAEWFHDLLEADETKEGRAYWNAAARSRLGSQALPSERKRRGEGEFTPHSVSVTVEPCVAAELASLATRYRTTAEVLLLACWQALLWRLSGRGEALVGVAHRMRKYAPLKNKLGLFAKYLPLRVRPSGDLSVGELAAQSAELMREAEMWQEYFTWESLGESNGSREE